MKILDLFCGEGFAADGMNQAYPDAQITGVDIVYQKHYPYRFIQADALTFDCTKYDVIWASPPCQGYSRTKNYNPGKAYPMYIDIMLAKLNEIGKPYIIENVVGAPLPNAVTLCGRYFGLYVYRHRLFTSNVHLVSPGHAPHAPNNGDIVTVAGKQFDMATAKRAMGITRRAVPPAYSRYLLPQLVAQRF